MIKYNSDLVAVKDTILDESQVMLRRQQQEIAEHLLNPVRLGSKAKDAEIVRLKQLLQLREAFTAIDAKTIRTLQRAVVDLARECEGTSADDGQLATALKHADTIKAARKALGKKQ